MAPQRWSQRWRQASIRNIDLAEKRLSPSRVAILGTVLVWLGALGFYFLPGMIDDAASGTRVVNSLYCAVMTLTTVGFGDICPSDEISSEGKVFLVLLAFSGLGMFVGPVMDLAASWKDKVPGGLFLLTTTTIAFGILLFTWLEEMSHLDAVYFSIVTGTTIGFGDVSVSSDAGKLAVATYAILVINVVGALLEPAKDALQSVCYVAATGPDTAARVGDKEN